MMTLPFVSSPSQDNIIITMAEPVATATSAQDFQTPDRPILPATRRSLRGSTTTHFEEKKDDAESSKRSKAATVTPSDAFTARKANAAAVHAADAATSEAEDDKQKVRFGKDGEREESAADDDDKDNESAGSSESPATKKKRGLVSRRGGRCGSPGRSLGTPTSSSSPLQETEAHAAATAVLEFKTFRSPERKQRDENDTVPSLCSTASDAKSSAAGIKQDEASEKKDDKSNNDENCTKPSSIQIDASDNTNSASPLKDEAPAKKSGKSEGGASAPKKSTVTFSPHIKTPVRSPSGGRVASLPNLYDAPMGSPSGIFMSPTTPTALERKTKAKNMPLPDSSGMRAPLTPRTPKGGKDGLGLLTTPTDFAFDYGKHPMSGSLLDSSNVLSWLHSPSANGLFSPGGGLGSMVNTPKGGVPRTPHTPTVSSTSFFFSDVAGLPRGSEMSSPSKGGLQKRSAGGANSTICISPLSSHKAKGGIASALSPKSPKLDMGMFASPAERSGMAKLGMKRGTGLDASSNDYLGEDEDLSRLLQLANNTPRPPGLPGAVTSSENGDAQKQDGTISGLSLPTIGGGSGEASGAKLTRKTLSRDQGDSSEEPKPNAATSSSPDAKTLPPNYSSMQSQFMTSYHQHEAVYNPSLYPGMSHGGSMRVVVGGPPRAKNSTSPGTIRYTVGRPGDFPAHYPHPSHYQHPGMPPHMHPQYSHYPPPPHHGAPRHLSLYDAGKGSQKKQPLKAGVKRAAPTGSPKQAAAKKTKKVTPGGSQKKKNRSPQLVDKADRQRAAATIQAVNQASGGKNGKAAALAAAILRGVTMRPSGKWQAQLYFAGKSRYIGVFDTREKAALAYEIARERLKAEKNPDGAPLSPKQTENAVNAARKAAFDGVNERGP
ncbi:MAG: hypothetical protein SGILL_006722 [Bacillariaceae sp.]